ncbi:hypothetical protein N9V90_02865 [Endozoicomonas sp.]|nr:hypothetical protein [Endozoicomonas sp.]
MDITTVIILILIPVCIGIMLSLVYWTLCLGISPTPTSPKVKKTLTAIFPSAINGEVHELGSGWGSLLSAIEAYYPDAPLIAHERSPIPRYFSIITHYLRQTKTTITGNNLFDIDLSHAGLVICYLYPGAMKTLSTHFAIMLPDNCWIISHTFHLPGWAPVNILTAPDLYKTPVYLYRKSKKKSAIAVN